MAAFDTIFIGGSAFTAGWETSRPVGIGVRDGRIAAVAPDDELRDAGAAEIVDLRGGLVLPGFHDAHAHPVVGGLELLQCDLTAATDADDAVARVAAYAAAHPGEEWIRGGGWTMSHFAGGTPTRQLLDAVVPDRPVALSNRDHHGTWANSLALRLAGVDATTPDPADGRIERESDGTPAGTLHEGAASLLDPVLPSIDRATALRALDRAQQEFFALGIVGWQDAWVGNTAGIDDVLDAYLDGVDAGTLRMRVTAALWWQRDRGLDQLDDLVRRRERAADVGRPDILQADTVKIMVDGVAEDFTAALSAPYLDRCGHATDNRGLTFVAPDALADAVTALDAAGFHVHFHALGDRAVTVALDAIAAARAANGPRAARHQLAHLQMVRSADVRRFAELGATANLQMLWGGLDEQLEQLTFPFVARELVARHYPFRELRDAGAALCAGSDWPVSSADPLAAIHVGVNRAEPGAAPDARMNPEQALDLATALSAYTAGSARACGRASLSGSLTTGNAADLAVLDADPFAVDPRELHGIGVRHTRVGGQTVYDHP
ncbi:amidohydrolase [Microbacterium horticulturae]|uniref:Amidohydrolase n=1 Tax=Microbacterium horticulturae TaxID=3028316 RepID=A0ABY8BZP5_9MICO|nr:amidohydrolase [Microbacterium sp. KACC 23027]WEG09342.1 amidohydrolase [Microbacterium sp. KACC 23027]